jgi:hypothetical protein
MAYTCDLGGGQHVYLDNVGDQTAVTLASTGPGQQQQSGSQFTTGPWTQAPEFFRIDPGVVIKLTTAQGAQFLQLQGQQLGWMVQPPTLANAQQMQTSTVAAMPGGSMPPMQPMASTTTGTAPKMRCPDAAHATHAAYGSHGSHADGQYVDEYPADGNAHGQYGHAHGGSS